MHDEVMKSSLAGTWYTEDSVHLGREVDAYLAAAGPSRLKEVMALILPHAGYRYSGMVAAKGIKQLESGTYRRVIILGPSHYIPLMDAVSLPDHSAIETPFGEVPLDVELMEALLETPEFTSVRRAHTDEHSVQIELPMLQRMLGDFKVVPVVCGQLSRQAAERIGETLRKHLTPDTLVVVSTDFTHYGRRFGYVPFTDDVERRLETLDMGAFDLIRQKKPAEFLAYVEETGTTICGRSPLAVLLSMLPVEAEVHLLKYETSGSLTGDWSHCVSYLSAAVTGHWPAQCPDGVHCGPRDELSEADKISLLQLARHRLERAFTADLPDLNLDITPGMKAVMGLFVTLHKQGMLRGCIGEILPRRALVDGVREQVMNAAFQDPRFPRLQAGELEEVDIEISALTPPKEIAAWQEIVIGRDGIILQKGGCSAVFLPQVAVEQGWNVEETLTHLAVKAGLSSDDWRDDCSFQVFEAIVFGEKD